MASNDNWVSKKVQGWVAGVGNAAGGAVNVVGNGVSGAGRGMGGGVTNATRGWADGVRGYVLRSYQLGQDKADESCQVRQRDQRRFRRKWVTSCDRDESTGVVWDEGSVGTKLIYNENDWECTREC